jgi:aralkylamine N-acetyltransferase
MKRRGKNMSVYIKTSTEDVDWERVAWLLKSFGLSGFDANTQEKVFKNSYATAFVYDDEKIIGVGRALSDGICQAAIYNIALDEEYHGKQIGRDIIENLLDQVKGCNVILYTHPQTVAMYEKFGFRRMKTGMAIYQADHLEFMEQMGFLLPEKHRFKDNEFEMDI